MITKMSKTYSEDSTEKGEIFGGKSEHKKRDKEPKVYDLRMPKKESNL